MASDERSRRFMPPYEEPDPAKTARYRDALDSPLIPALPRPTLPDLERIEWAVIERFLTDFDASATARVLGVPLNRVLRLIASRRGAIAMSMYIARRASRVELEGDELLRRAYMVATADVRELVRVVRGSCRYCYGSDHRFQRTQEELRRVRNDHVRRQLNLPEPERVEFDDEGGDGYDKYRAPASDCPECFGRGIRFIEVTPTDELSPAAAMLFDGVKVSKAGDIEVKVRSRDKSADLVAMHLGIKKPRDLGDAGLPDPDELDDDTLERYVKTLRNRLYGADGAARELSREP